MDIKLEQEFEVIEEELIIKEEYVSDPEPKCTYVPTPSKILLKTCRYSKKEEYEDCNYRRDDKSKKYVCPFCVYQTNVEDSFSVHLNIHVKTYVCNQCGYIAKNPKNLKQHKVEHTPKVNVQCKQCKYKATSEYRLQQHMRVHFQCEQCKYRTTTKSGLEKHMQTHCRKPFQCEQCEYKTTSKSRLQRHKLVHVKKPNQCKHCNYKTTHKYNLRKHLRNHAFKCHTCTMRFKKKTLLQAHELVHNEETQEQQDDDASFLDYDIVPNECIVFNSIDFLVEEEPNVLVS